MEVCECCGHYYGETVNGKVWESDVTWFDFMDSEVLLCYDCAKKLGAVEL